MTLLNANFIMMLSNINYNIKIWIFTKLGIIDKIYKKYKGGYTCLSSK